MRIGLVSQLVSQTYIPIEIYLPIFQSGMFAHFHCSGKRRQNVSECVPLHSQKPKDNENMQKK